MKFVFLKAQVLEVVGKARETVDKFVVFCRRIGGSVRVGEDAKFYKVSCILPSPRGLEAVLNDKDGLYISSVEESEWIRFEPASRSMSLTAHAYSPRERIVTSSVDLDFGVGATKGGGVSGKFTKLRLDVSKNNDEVHLWLGE